MVEEVKRIIKSYLENASLTDATIGTVTSEEPLEITLQQTMLPIPKDCLYLTEGVIEKAIDKIEHVHKYDDYNNGTGASGHRMGIDTQKALENYQVYENGKALGYNKDGKMIINEGLKVGHIVLLLRVKKGERYIVLSRLF